MNIQIHNNLVRKAYCTQELARYLSFIGGGMGLISPQKFSFLVLMQELLGTKTKTKTDYLQIP